MDKPFIVGCDEVGTGSLAGPLIVCGVKAHHTWSLPGLNDSKKLSAKKREAMLLPIMKEVGTKVIDYHKAIRTNAQIDKMGLAAALKDAYVECFLALYQDDCLIICDGTLKFDNAETNAFDKVSIIKADTKFPTVMAASIIAKVSRDADMQQLHWKYPEYEWLKNVGYGSKSHLAAIKKYGPSPLHRMSYAPMKFMTLDDPRQLPLFVEKV